MMFENVNRMYIGENDTIQENLGYIEEQTVLSVVSNDDYKPIPQKVYFRSKLDTNINIPTFIIGMVFYNEDSKELHRSMISFGKQLMEIRDLCKSQVVIVGDGIHQMHPSTNQYLYSLFCKNSEDEKIWNTMINDLQNDVHKTYVIQRHVPNDDNICCIKVGDYQYPITLILKSKNRRKHNSQEWILNSFVPQSCKTIGFDVSKLYILMTDCGTLFEDKCMFRLLKYMISNPKCVGATARQRVMTAKEQNMDEEENWISSEKFLRMIQLADYEVSYATYTGAFSAAGCLPVLPGPCAMFRYSGLLSTRTIKSHRSITSDIESRIDESMNQESMNQESMNQESMNQESMNQESALEHYNNIVDIPIEETNICIENVKLAEDRIPSYSIITHGDKEAYTTWVDGAVFKFQAETTLEHFILQRRRWINGAFSCYVWNCLIHPGLIINSRLPIYRKFLILLLYWMQLLNYVFAMCTYGIMSGSLYISLLSLFDISPKVSLMISMMYGSIVICHLMVHKYTIFIRWFTIFVGIINSIVLIGIVSGFISEIIHWGGLINGNTGRMLIVFCAIVIVCIPFVMALISLDIKSICYVLFSFIPYWLFLPTLVGTFVMYSIARFSDITWGNRISDPQSSFHRANPEQISNLKTHMENISGIILLAVILFNIGIASILILSYTTPFVIGIIFATIVGVFLIQCLISIIYFIIKHISCSTCSQRI